MKILVVSLGVPPRGRFGTEFYTSELARGLARRGHELAVLHPDRALPGPAYALAESLEEGLRVVRWKSPSDRPARFERSYCDGGAERVFGSWLERHEPDVVHFTYLLGDLSLRLPWVARARRIPSVVTLTDYGLLCHRGQMFDWRAERCFGPHPPAVCARCIRTSGPYDAGPLERRARNGAAEVLARLGGIGGVPTRRDLERREAAVRETFESVERFVAPTRHLGEVFRGAGLPEEKLRTLVYSFDEAPYRPHRSSKPPELPRFGFLAQFAAHKGLGTLVEAARILDRENPARAWEVALHGTTVAGRNARYAPRVLQRADPRRIKISDPFEPSRAPEVLASLSALVLPSAWDENAPLSVLQARAIGVPLLASAVPGIAEVASPRSAAWFSPGDAAALAERMRDVLEGRIRRDPAPGLPLAFEDHLQAIEAIYADARDSRR